MANTSYLCATNVPTIYPSFVQPDYDPRAQLIACDVYCVPLLWFALFRTGDIVSKTFEVDDGSLNTEAPLVAVAQAITQLDAACPYFDQLFAAEGGLAGYASFLRQALSDVHFDYVTIELQEIACMSDPEQAYYDEVRAALAGIDVDRTPAAKRRLVKLAQLRNLQRFPSPRLLIDDLEGPDDDYWNFCRVLGAGAAGSGFGRPVPWERG